MLRDQSLFEILIHSTRVASLYPRQTFFPLPSPSIPPFSFGVMLAPLPKRFSFKSNGWKLDKVTHFDERLELSCTAVLVGSLWWIRMHKLSATLVWSLKTRKQRVLKEMDDSIYRRLIKWLFSKEKWNWTQRLYYCDTCFFSWVSECRLKWLFLLAHSPYVFTCANGNY